MLNDSSKNKERNNVHLLDVQFLLKVRECTAVSSPNYLDWLIVKAPPASLEPRLYSPTVLSWRTISLNVPAGARL